MNDGTAGVKKLHPARPTSIDTYLALWELLPEGTPVATHSSRLLPVRWRGQSAMLKIADADEERAGSKLMVWWQGRGSAQVLAYDDDAILLERAEGTSSLSHLAKSGYDDEATRIICQVAAQLHRQMDKPRPDDLVPLEEWFWALEPAAAEFGGVLIAAAEVARHLLATPQEMVVLHGDIHYGNILDFGTRGWRAIDPKGLRGERGFDYANIFCNPDLEAAARPGRLARQVKVVAKAAGLQRTRLLQWVLAYAGLSAAWTLRTGETPEVALTVAALAAAQLHNGRT